MTSTPPGREPDAHVPAGLRPRGRWRLAAVLAAAALALSGYLAFVALAGDGRPAGCGDAAGCGSVLTSAWSKVLGVPVALPAALLYAAVLAHLLVHRRAGGLAMAVAAGTMLGAAGWFTAVQAVHLGTLCRYCLLSHALAVALAGVLLRDTRAPVAAGGLALGVLATAALALTQTLAPSAVPDPVVQADGGGERAGRVLTLLDGRLTVDLSEENVTGDADHTRLLVKLFDYACPHCRAAHGLLSQRPDIAVVHLPVPLNPACNRFMQDLPMAAMAHSCDLAKTALALTRVSPDQMPAFDDWMFDDDGWPRTAEDALAHARTLADPLLLDLALADPDLDARLRRNVGAWGAARDAELVGGLPVLLRPGGGLTYGRLGDGAAIDALFDDAPDAPADQPAPDTSAAEPAHD